MRHFLGSFQVRRSVRGPLFTRHLKIAPKITFWLCRLELLLLKYVGLFLLYITVTRLASHRPVPKVGEF